MTTEEIAKIKAIAFKLSVELLATQDLGGIIRDAEVIYRWLTLPLS